jgi:hypothetical protein
LIGLAYTPAGCTRMDGLMQFYAGGFTNTFPRALVPESELP